MMMDENVKKILEEYSKKAEEDMHMFFEQMKKESLNQHEVKLSKSRYYNLSKMNLKELSKKQLIRIIYSLQQDECFQHMIMLEKALDKACKELSYKDNCLVMSAEEWKEWCLKDD